MPSAVSRPLRLDRLGRRPCSRSASACSAGSISPGIDDPPTSICSTGAGGGLDDLVGRARARPVEHLRQHDHAEAQGQEQDRGVGDLVADALDDVEEAARALRVRCGARRLRAHERPPACAAIRPRKSASATSSSRTRRAARARWARGCWRSRRSCRRAGRRPWARRPGERAHERDRAAAARRDGLGAPRGRPRRARGRDTPGCSCRQRSRCRSGPALHRELDAEGHRAARGGATTAACASAASCSGCTRTLSFARAYGWTALSASSTDGHVDADHGDRRPRPHPRAERRRCR